MKCGKVIGYVRSSRFSICRRKEKKREEKLKRVSISRDEERNTRMKPGPSALTDHFPHVGDPNTTTTTTTTRPTSVSKRPSTHPPIPSPPSPSPHSPSPPPLSPPHHPTRTPTRSRPLYTRPTPDPSPGRSGYGWRWTVDAG